MWELPRPNCVRIAAARTVPFGEERHMNGIIYLVGLVVVVLFVLSFLGLH
jgi:hypothetical protein